MYSERMLSKHQKSEKGDHQIDLVLGNGGVKGFLTVCALYAQFSEDQNSVFKPRGAICLVSAQ